MTRENLAYIQQKIGYSFKNFLLLQQAFIRRSYSQEHPEFENNEILEFIGDSELDSYIVRKLADEFGGIEDSQFTCKKNEGELTKLKSRYVDKNSLSHCIDTLGFGKYLIMGKNDIKNRAENSESVKEDLFEAIVGAVAVDSNFDKEKVGEVCSEMLGYLDFDDDYISLVSDWCKENGYAEPSYMSSPVRTVDGTYTCSVSATNRSTFDSIKGTGEGKTIEFAKMDAAENLYFEHCETADMLSAVGEPDAERAVSQLHELAQKGFFDEPKYSFEESHDEYGRPTWRCSCKIDDYDNYYWAIRSTKKKAMKKAAYLELLYVLGIENSDDYNDDDDFDLSD